MKQVTKKILTLILVLPLVLACLSPEAAAWENLVSRRTEGMFGFKGGLISRGRVKNERRIRTEVGVGLQVFADLPAKNRFFYTIAFDFYDIKMPRDRKWMIDASIALKYLRRNDRLKMEFKPYVAFGFGLLGDVYIFEQTDYWTVKLGFETHFEINPKRLALFELAVLKAYSGPTNDYGSAIGPLFLFRAGIGLR